MRNHLPDAVPIHIQRVVFSFRWNSCGAAVIAGRGTLQNKGDQFLRVVWVLQSTVDGVGQADHFFGGLIGLLAGSIVFRYLMCDILQQHFIRNGDHSTAFTTLEVQRVRSRV